MRTQDLIHWCAPARTILGCGVRTQLPSLLKRMGFTCGVLVTDTYFTSQTPWVQELVSTASTLGIRIHIYSGGIPDPTTTLCDLATVTINTELAGTPVDHVIALGGGSNIDLAKALCLTLVNNRPVVEFAGAMACTPSCLPLIALPTTAGTGSEATPGAILIDPENSTKIAIMDNALRPIVALIDPELSYTCPPRVTGDAGIDALTHAVESYLTMDSWNFDRADSPDPGYSGRSSLTMMFALESIKLCAQYLERCYKNGNDSQARIGMAYASYYAALSYGSAGLNAVHGIAYAVAGQTHQSHGSTNAVMLPYVLDAMRTVRRKELIDIGRVFGLSGDDDSVLLGTPARIRELVASLDIPTNLNDFGIKLENVDQLIANALDVVRLAKAFPVQNPDQVYREIVNCAWQGRLAADN